jgi:hypothetical protein
MARPFFSPIASPLTTRRVTVEVFDPASTQVFLWDSLRCCQYLDYIALNNMESDEWERIWKEVVVAPIEVPSWHLPDGLRKSTENLSQYSWCPH